MPHGDVQSAASDHESDTVEDEPIAGEGESIPGASLPGAKQSPTGLPLVSVSATSGGMRARWREEIRALKPSKRARWHGGRLWDQWRVAQKVRRVYKSDLPKPVSFGLPRSPSRSPSVFGGGSATTTLLLLGEE